MLRRELWCVHLVMRGEACNGVPPPSWLPPQGAESLPPTSTGPGSSERKRRPCRFAVIVRRLWGEVASLIARGSVRCALTRRFRDRIEAAPLQETDAGRLDGPA